MDTTSIPNDQRPFWVKLCSPSQRPCHMTFTLTPEHPAPARVTDHEFILHGPGKGVKIRHDFGNGNQNEGRITDVEHALKARRRRGGGEFVNTSSINEMYLPSANVAAHHADIMWSNTGNKLMIKSVNDNTTMINHDRLKKDEFRELRVGDSIRFGNGAPEDPFSHWTVKSISWGQHALIQPSGNTAGMFFLGKVSTFLFVLAYTAAAFMFINWVYDKTMDA
ncbi:hypothetical protein IWX49DRAFT_591592 [Phyllosticta citricarpa]|uniref:FHA domain-containing protein n=2 Tax=Phyllosticta TaxID=121621 RepID=A0ABR1M7B5_9PEZI